MHILHLCSQKHWRGGEQQIAYLVEELSSNDVQSTVLARSGSALEQYCRKHGVTSQSASYTNTLDLTTALAIGRLCKKQQVDIMHAHTPVAHGLGLLSCVLGNKTPLVVSRKVAFALRRNPFTRWKYNHEQVCYIIGVSEMITGMMRDFVKEPSKCVTIYDGIDLEKFAATDGGFGLRDAFGLPPDCMLIGNTSALEAGKDFNTFIDTIQLLVGKGHKVHGFIIGVGPMRGALESYVSAMGLESAITFTGFRDDVSIILPQLDVFLMTSRVEGLGTSLLDAMLARVPVVATRAGGIPEIVRDEQTGLLADVGDRDALARQVVRILTDRGLRDALVAAGSDSVKNFSKEEMTKKTLALYRNLQKQ